MIQRGADLDPVRQGVSRAVFGRFVFQRNGREQIAAAMTDGSFRILAGESWKEIENWPGVTSATAQVLRGRISGGAMDDVIVIDDRCRHGFGHHA